MRLVVAVIISFFVSPLVFSFTLLLGAGGMAFIYAFISFIAIIVLSRIKFGKNPDKMPNMIIKLQQYVPKVENTRDSMRVPVEKYVSMPIAPEEVELETFMSPPKGHKSNNSIAVAGIAGVGKTTLVRYLIEHDNSKHKIIFSFKEKDEYLYMGIPILDISQTAPNPFADYAAFSDAFITANPIESKGIQASSIKPRLLKLLAHSTNWKEFFSTLENSEKIADKKGDSNAAPVFALIRDQAEALAQTPTRAANISDYINEHHELVLDFSNIRDKMAQTFYSEIILRQLWHADFYSRENPALLAIDEAHRLVGDKAQDSILVLILREGRSRGLKVIASTQRYTDIYDAAMSNFATQLMFHTNNRHDLDALPTEMIKHAVLELQPSFFVDANQSDLHQSVEVMCLNRPENEKHEAEYIKIEKEHEEEPRQKVSKANTETKILELLEDKPMTPTELTKVTGIEKTQILNVLTSLRKRHGVIDYQTFDIPHTRKHKSYYYLKGKNVSSLHIFMQNEVIKALEEGGYKIIRSTKSGEHEPINPDIETKDAFIEIETGLNTNFSKLTNRINKSNKVVWIIVPNRDIEEDYVNRYKLNLVFFMYDFIEQARKKEILAHKGLK